MSGRAWKAIALAVTALALAGCTADRTLNIRTIDGPDSSDVSVTSARVEQAWGGRTELILELVITNPSANIDLTNWVDLGNSYMLWCDGEPRRSPGPGVSTWTYDCDGDTDWPRDVTEASLAIRVDD